MADKKNAPVEDATIEETIKEPYANEDVPVSGVKGYDPETGAFAL